MSKRTVIRATVAAATAFLLAAAPAVARSFDDDTSYVPGICGGSIAPEPDPCEAAKGVLAYTFVYHLVNAQTFKNWKRDNPGEYARLTAFMADPYCPTPANNSTRPAVLMKTMLGAALVNVFQAYACALGAGPVVLPAPNPKPSGPDKTPPTMPGPITVLP